MQIIGSGKYKITPIKSGAVGGLVIERERRSKVRFQDLKIPALHFSVEATVIKDRTLFPCRRAFVSSSPKGGNFLLGEGLRITHLSG